MKLIKAPSLKYTFNMKKNNTTWIIDDDPIQVFVAKRMLKNIGFSQNIQSLDNGKNALEELHDLTASEDNRLPDIIFLDINMPQMDGWQFLKEFEKISVKKKVAVYLMTSSIDPVDARRAKTWDSLSGYLIKPLKTEDLEEILEEYEEQ